MGGGWNDKREKGEAGSWGNLFNRASVRMKGWGKGRTFVVFLAIAFGLNACSQITTTQSAVAINPSGEETKISTSTQKLTAEKVTGTPTSTLMEEGGLPRENSPTPEMIPTKTMIPSPTASPTVVGCQEESGKVELFNIQSDLVPYEVTGRIYTPPCYDPEGIEEYPAVYLLHGQSFNDDQWERLGGGEAADRLIRDGDAAPFLIVMPFEKYYLEDQNTSTFNIVLLDVILPWVDQNYRTCTLATCRAIGGISRGAAWAMRLGLTRWDLFGAIGAHSFPPFRGDVYNLPYWFQDIPLDNRPRILIDIGRFDPYLKAAVQYESWMTEYKIPHEWQLNEGTHNEEYWQLHLEDYLRWYSEAWKVE